MSEKLLSVIITTYKRNDYISRAIDSVLSQEGDYEIIVVDDNDDTSIYREKNQQIMKKYDNLNNFKYLQHKKNKNGAAARNTGIKEASGKYITFLDDDDEFCENRIKRIEEKIRSKNYDFICTGVIKKYSDKTEEYFMPNLDKGIFDLQIELLKQKSFLGTGSNIVCKKELIDLVNGFDEKFIRHQDIEFMIRYLENCQSICVIPEYLVIKNTEDKLNIPDLNKMIYVKNLFFQKFDSLMQRLPKNEKNKILYLNYYEMLRNAYVHNNSDIKKARKVLKEKKLYRFCDDFKLYIRYIVKKVPIFKRLIVNIKNKRNAYKNN